MLKGVLKKVLNMYQTFLNKVINIINKVNRVAQNDGKKNGREGNKMKMKWGR